MSPALTHVEQSRNTLFFATCAKDVTNTAKVNMVRVVSCDFESTFLCALLLQKKNINEQLVNTFFIQVVSNKQLVKHLQTEVARLEAELRTPDRTSSSDILIMEKNTKIRQVLSLTVSSNLQELIKYLQILPF
jgi:centromeric protein E